VNVKHGFTQRHEYSKTAGMRFLKTFRGWDRRDKFLNRHIRRELNVTEAVSIKYNWLFQVGRINKGRKVIKYRPKQMNGWMDG